MEADADAEAQPEPAALTERRGSVMVITINRPEARNAVNGAVSTAVGDALAQAQHDTEVRAVVITGAGDKSFCAGAGGVFRIIGQLPRKVALQMLLTGEPISAAEAARWGLINQVVRDGTGLEAALALAERVTVNAPLSVQASKRIAYGADDGAIPDEEPGWARTEREFRLLLKSEDAKEGPLAFAEKRPPVWKAR
jgi:enoyl-CoA hydratase/carnithine racemase